MSIQKLSSRVQEIVITQLIAVLMTPITDLAAYELKLIDSKGNVIKEPTSAKERKALSKTVVFALALRPYLERNSAMREQDKINLRNKHAQRSIYSQAQKDATMLESMHNDSFELIKELSSAEIFKRKADKHAADTLKVSSRYTMLNPKKRKGYLKTLFGTSGTFGSPVTGDDHA
ncbi:hypothetical protein RRL34_004268 [Vibrio parahaemolyticus]|nr:hypothetical protein [Vibrio parahaemolyticus]